MAIPSNATNDLKSSVAIYFNQALQGFAAASETGLLTQMSAVRVKNSVVTDKDAKKFYKAELKKLYPNGIDKQALVDLMEANTGVDLSPADEAALVGLKKPEQIILAFLQRQDVRAEFNGDVLDYQQDLAAGTAEFGSDSDLKNAAPTDITPNTASVAETIAAGSVITTLAAVDPDAGDTFTFQLITDASAKFEIVGNQLKLKAGESLDFETAPSHAVTVQVTDQDGETYQEVLTINVTNVGNAPTDIAPDNATVAEDISTVTPIMTLSFVDPGPEFPGVHTFTLVDDPSGLFEIVGNVVSLKAGASLDFETATSHQITVKVTDPEGLTYQETLTINVSNVQDGNIVALQLGTDNINTTNVATSDNDTFIGSTNFSQNFAFGPINVDASSTARSGDKIDGGDDTGDIFDLTLSGSVASAFQDVVSTGIETRNVEILRVHNQVQTSVFGEDVIVDMSQHYDVKDVQLPLPDSDIMLRDMQNAGGTILIQDPSLGDEMDVQIDFDLQALNGVGHANDTLTIQVEEVNGADILITQDAEGNGGEFGDGVAAALETLTVDFVNIDSRIDELRSNGTSTFIFTGDANAAIGDGPAAIDLFGANPAYTSADSFFDDMGNTASLIDASTMTGSLYINLSEASNDFDFLGGTGADTTVIGNSLVSPFGTTTFDGGTGADNTAVLWDEFSVTGVATDNPLVNYQRVAFTEAMGVSPGGLFNAAFMGQQVRDILLMDGLSDGGFGLTVTNTDALPAGTIFHFQDELPPLASNFPADDDGANAEGNGETMTFLTSGAAAATVSVHFDDFSLLSDEITFAGNVGVMNLGGNGLLFNGVEATFDGGMDNLTTINATGNNQFELLSTGVLNSLATINATGNTGGVEMQNGPLSVFSEADHTAVSDINSGVLGLTLTGGDGDDVFIGSAGSDVINGNGDDDVLFGNAGIDFINGGSGNDSAQGGDDTDFITGGLGNDDLVGGDGGDFIDGNEGEDTLYGWAGTDDLDGGTGNDLVKGGGGSDIVAGGLGVDEHWGDRDPLGGDVNDPEGGPILGDPETSTITIDNVEPGDSFAVSVSGLDGQGAPILVVYAATAVDTPDTVAAALSAQISAALGVLANVSVASNVVTIESINNGDAFEVATTTTNRPAVPDIETMTFSNILDIGDTIDVEVDGVTYTIDIEAPLASSNETAAYVQAALASVLPANFTATVSGSVVTISSANGIGIGLVATVTNGDTPNYITLSVSGFDPGAGEFVQVEVPGGGNYTEASLVDLANAVINDGSWSGTTSDLIIELPNGDVRIYSSNALATGNLVNLGVIGGAGAGNPATPVATPLVAADADTDPAVASIQNGSAAGVDSQTADVVETVPAVADQDLTDDNTGFFSDTFVIETGTGPLVVSATASDDGVAGLFDDVVTTDADALSSMDRIMDWDAGTVQDFLNFAALNVDGDINNYTESDGATSLLDAIASINFMLSTGRDFAAAEVFLANAVTENQTAATAGSNLTLGAGTYHTIVGADTNGDNVADSMVILVGVGSAGAGVDGFTQTDIVQV